MIIFRFLYYPLILLGLFVIPLKATTHALPHIELTGDITGLTFKPLEEIYVATADLIIPPKSAITIPEGTIIFFKNNSGLFIEGSCEINGTTTNPVIFTSFNDTLNTKHNTIPTQYDWTGIRISKTASTIFFNHLFIKYAIRPIESLSPTITLKAIRRFSTMEESFIINGKVHPVQSNSDFFFPSMPPPTLKKTKKIVLTSPSTPPPAPSATPAPPNATHKWWKNRTCRISLFSTGFTALLAGGGCLTGYLLKDAEYNDKISIYEDTTHAHPVRYEAYTAALNASDSRNMFSIAGIVSSSVGALLLSLFGLTFYF